MTSDGTLRLMSEIGKHSNSSEPWTNSHVRSGLSQSDRFVGRTKKLPVCRQWRFYVGLGGAIAPPVLALHPHFGMVQQLLSLWIKLFYFVVLIEMTENLKFHCAQTDDETFFFESFINWWGGLIGTGGLDHKNFGALHTPSFGGLEPPLPVIHVKLLLTSRSFSRSFWQLLTDWASFKFKLKTHGLQCS